MLTRKSVLPHAQEVSSVYTLRRIQGLASDLDVKNATNKKKNLDGRQILRVLSRTIFLKSTTTVSHGQVCAS